MTNHRSKNLILAALFAALTAVFSQISIPLPFTPIPLNLATLAVLLAGGLLGAKYAFFSQIIYLFLGLFGLPVFAQFTGGPVILFGPSGGFLFGYALSAGLTGLLLSRLQKKRTADIPAMGLIFLLSTLACYTAGTLWFMYVTGSTIIPALIMCVLPFLPGDAMKLIAAILLTKRLLPRLAQL